MFRFFPYNLTDGKQDIVIFLHNVIYIEYVIAQDFQSCIVQQEAILKTIKIAKIIKNTLDHLE